MHKIENVYFIGLYNFLERIFITTIWSKIYEILQTVNL